MKAYVIQKHLIELKMRLAKVFIFFIVAFIFCYSYSSEIYHFFISPLADVISGGNRKMIYTGLTEAFFTYIKISSFCALMLSMPIISFQVYQFIAPGLYAYERKIASMIIFFAPLLFWVGGIAVFYLVIPNAWQFFLGFELTNEQLPLMLEARISEYLNLVMHLIIAFGLAAELPIVLIILNLMHIVSCDFLVTKRRLAIVIIFIIAGIITPPDVLSQISLAMPMVLLYETSILICRFLEKRTLNARH